MADILSQFPIEPEWVTEAEKEETDRAEAMLVPDGTYEGQILSYVIRDGHPNSIYAGKTIIHCTRELYNVGLRASRTDFFDLSPEKVRQSNGRLGLPSKLMGELAGITGTAGRDAEAVMTAALLTRLSFRIGKKAASGEFKARNVTYKISAAK